MAGLWKVAGHHCSHCGGTALTNTTAIIACPHLCARPGAHSRQQGPKALSMDHPAVHVTRAHLLLTAAALEISHCRSHQHNSAKALRLAAAQAAGMPSSISSDALRPADCSQGCGASRQPINAPLADHQQCAAPAAAVQQLTDTSPAEVGLGGRQALGTEQPAEQAETPQAAVSPLAPACLGSPRGQPAAPPPGPCRA